MNRSGGGQEGRVSWDRESEKTPNQDAPEVTEESEHQEGSGVLPSVLQKSILTLTECRKLCYLYLMWRSMSRNFNSEHGCSGKRSHPKTF